MKRLGITGVRDMMDVVFSIYIVMHGAVGARVWEV